MMNKKIIIAGSILLITLIGVLVYNLITPKAYIKFAVAPEQVIVTSTNLNKTVKNGDGLTLAPGSYKITISHDGFISSSVDINIKNHETQEILMALTPQTDASKQLLLSDAAQAVMQRYYGKVRDETTKKLLINYPIIDILPIQARLYTISACPSQKYPNDTTKIALCVIESQSGLDPYVLKDILSRGYNPSDYEIIWVRQYTEGE